MIRRHVPHVPHVRSDVAAIVLICVSVVITLLLPLALAAWIVRLLPVVLLRIFTWIMIAAMMVDPVLTGWIRICHDLAERVRR